MHSSRTRRLLEQRKLSSGWVGGGGPVGGDLQVGGAGATRVGTYGQNVHHLPQDTDRLRAGERDTRTEC